MRTRTKIMFLSVCATLLITASVFGTIAYLTDTTGVVNTFTIGKVDIQLDEAYVNLQGEPLDKNGKVVTDIEDAVRVKNNEYHLLPGQTYVKDPTLTVIKGSAKSYIRILVTINNIAELDAVFADERGADLLSIFNGYNNTKWIYNGEIENTTDNTITYEFRYFETVDASNAVEDMVLEALFDSITVPGEITTEELGTLNDFKITVVGHAIQAAGFNTADAAWNAFSEQVNK